MQCLVLGLFVHSVLPRWHHRRSSQLYHTTGITSLVLSLLLQSFEKDETAEIWEFADVLQGEGGGWPAGCPGSAVWPHVWQLTLKFSSLIFRVPQNSIKLWLKNGVNLNPVEQHRVEKILNCSHLTAIHPSAEVTPPQVKRLEWLSGQNDNCHFWSQDI